jgi:hypothetical protein
MQILDRDNRRVAFFACIFSLYRNVMSCGHGPSPAIQAMVNQRRRE